MKRRDILRKAAGSAAVPMFGSTVSGSSTTSPSLQAERLDGKEERRTLQRAWRDVRELRLAVKRRYGFTFSRRAGGAKRITSEVSGNRLTMAAFGTGFDSLGRRPADSRHGLITWTAENGESADASFVVEGMAADFDDVSLDALSDPELEETIEGLDVPREQAMRSHVSVIRTYDGDDETTYLNVHENEHEYGLLAEQAANSAGAEVSVSTETEESDILYSARVVPAADGVSTMGHGGGDLMDCVKDAPLGATAIACIASCVNAGTIIGAVACAACGCYAGCWVANCSKHLGNRFCYVTDFNCALSIFFPPNAGTCCLAFGCHFDCAWLE